MRLVVAGEDDKAGAKACDDARKRVKALRCEVEARRKDLKADALEYGRRVDAEAKRLTGLLSPIEAHLEGQVAIVADAEARRKAEAERALDERLERRLAELQAVRTTLPPLGSLRLMPEDAYAKLLADATAAHEQVEAERRAERERLAKLEAEHKEEKRKAAEQEAENRRLRAELEVARKAELDRERKEREKAEAETRRAEAEKLAAERKAKEEREAREAETRRQEAEAAAGIADEKAFEAIKAEFPTLDLAWVEIHRLRKGGAA